MLAAALLGACAPAIDFGRATTLAKGDVRVSVGGEAALFVGDVRPEQTLALPWANLTVGARVGVTDRLELGGRAWAFGVPGLVTTAGLAADGKYQLHRARFRGDPHIATGLSLAVHSPAYGNQPWTVVSATVPVLVGFDVGRRGQFVFSPRVAGYHGGTSGQLPLSTVAVGAGLAWFLPLGKAEVVPELVYMWAPVGWAGARDDPERAGAEGLHLGVTLGWGP